jgi:HSP90 family molecular chaperone
MLLCIHKQAVNTVEAIWTKMPSEVDEKQYTEFYQVLYPLLPISFYHHNAVALRLMRSVIVTRSCCRAVSIQQ